MEQNILERILDGSMEPTDLPLETLRDITDKFSENRIIGEGGFGTVYKGVLQNGNVAVKKITSIMTINEKLFLREVDSLMEVNHRNVVKFLGFCSHTVHTPLKNPESRGYIYAEKRERLLCFEYISNGSLDKYITDELRGLEWDTRYQIINGICSGLYYLHVEKHILHMDLKPANILMDHQMVPKIADFGLSRPTDNSRTTSTNHYSSPPYCAPENIFGDGRMSVKSDIFSLGNIIMEIVTGHRDLPDDDKDILRRWKHRWNKSATTTPVAYQHQVMKCIEIGILCQSNDPLKRPFISDIMNEIGEMESMNNHIKNADEHAPIGQINSVSWEDDMLGIEPLELQFANYDHDNKHISSSCSVELSNNTDDFIAFNVQRTGSSSYCIDPNNNIVPPQSKLTVNITLPEATQDHDRHYKDQFIVRSTKVNEGLAVKDIDKNMFDKGKYVDEVHLTVFSEAQLQATSCVLLSEGPSNEVIPLQAEYSGGALLNVHPLVLHFPFIPNMPIQRSLHLTNNTDKNVVFRLMKKHARSSDYYVTGLPLHGIVPPSLRYTLVLTMSDKTQIPEEANIDLILQNSVADGDIEPFEDADDFDQFFEEVKERGDTLNEVALQAVYAPIGGTTNEIIPVEKTSEFIYSLEAHPTEPLIMIGHFQGLVQIWNYETQSIVHSVKVTTESVHCMKFVARKQWLLAGDHDGYIHVRDYGAKLKKIKKLGSFGRVTALAIHPTKPYVLSMAIRYICLWDWDNDWKCVRKYETFSNDVAFNPRNHDSFASASDDCTVQVWNIDSPQAIYSLSGHSAAVSRLSFFTRDEQLYLISGSRDLTMKVWDLEEKTCVHTIEGLTSGVTYVNSLPGQPYLLTLSRDGLVRLWSSSTYRLERIIDVQGDDKSGREFVLLPESKGFAIGIKRTVAVIDIDDEE